MAQYRAIFKHAYLKGLVSAVALSAGLVAGSAQADSVDYLTFANTLAEEADQNGFLITSGSNNGLTTEQLAKIKDQIDISTEITYSGDSISSGQRLFAKNVTISSSGSLTIDLGSDEHMMFNGVLKVAGGEFSVTGDSGSDSSHVNGAIKENPTIGDLTFNDFTGDLVIDSGKFTMKDSHIEVGDALINGGTLTFSSTIGDSDSWDKNAGLIAGGQTDGAGNGVAKFEINGNATVELGLGGALTSEEKTTLNVGASTINLVGGSTANYSSFILAKDTANFNNGSKVNVSGSGSGIYGKTLNFNSGATLDIASAGVLNLDGALQFSGEDSSKKNGSLRDAGTITVNGATITNSGSLIIGSLNSENSNGTTFKMTAGTLTNAGTLTVNTSTADFGSGLKNNGELIFNKGTSTTSVGSLGVLGTATGMVTVASGATLKLTDTAITFSENNFADSRHDQTASEDSPVYNNDYVNGTILNAGTIDASLAAVTIKSDNNHEYNGGSKNTNVLFMDGGKLIVGSLDVEQKTVTDGGVSYIEDFTVLGGTLTVNGNITGDKGDIKVFAIGGTYAEENVEYNGTLNLVNTKTTAATLTDINGIRVFGSPESSYSSKDKVQAILSVSGSWNFNGAGVKVGQYGTATFDGATVTNIGLMHTSSDAAGSSGSTIGIANSSLTASGIYLQSGSGSIALSNSSLSVTGAVGAAESGIKSGSIVLADNSTLTLTYAAATAKKGGDSDTNAKDDGLAAGVISADSTSALKLTGYKNADGSQEITLADMLKLKSDLLGSDFKGQFGLEGAKVTDANINDSGEVSFSDAQNASGITGVYDNATVTGVSGDVTGTHSWGNAQLATGTEQLQVGQGATIELNGSGALVKDEKGQTKGVTLASGSTVGLNGNNAEVGAVVATASGNGTVQVAGSLIVESIGSSTASVQQVKVLDNSSITLKNDVYTETIDASGTMDMGGNNLNITGTGENTIAGSVENANQVNASGSVSVTGSLNASEFTFTNAGQTLSVGDASNSASVSISTLDLNGGTIRFDPDYDKVVSVNDILNGYQGRGNVNGKIEILRNNIVAIGAPSSEAKEVASKYVNFDPADGSLIADQVGAVLYQNIAYRVGSNNEYIHISALDSVSGSNNTFVLEDHTAWILSGNLADSCTNQMDAAISFDNSTASVTLQSGSQIIIDGGNFLASDRVYLFSGASVTISDQGTKILAGNGLLNGKLDTTNGYLTFSLSENASDYLYAQSTPVKDMTLAVIANENSQYYVGDSGVAYISAIAAHNGGVAIEETARLAVYGGALQALNMAQQTSTDAVAERISSSGLNSSLVTSSNQNGGGLWLAPVYKNHDSDDFSAQGVNYGADIDLYGVALGADLTTSSGLRVGGYFNLGSGDANGQGVASDISNDFDYFGMGLYAGKKFGDFGLSADVGFTQISNDLEQNVNYNEIDKVTAETDATAITLGVNGEYTLKLGSANVVPHAGMRYTRLSIDSYDAKIDGFVVASTSSDTMNVFSIPVGVSVSSDLTFGNWIVRPLFDVTLTGNVGDTDIDSTTSFLGAENLNLSSEFMDSFTYGATLGLDASYDSFNVGIGVNYTGSSSAKEYGVSANARFVF